jgi:C_GCAxxG_C_C family probable redox protein
MENTSRKETAIALFEKGYNCCQSVVLAYADLLAPDQTDLARLASSFGGGVGRLREICGAVSGMAAVLGLLYGYSGPETGPVKAEHYSLIQNAAKEFEERNGSLICRELLNLTEKHDEPTPEPRTPAYYHNRACSAFVGNAAEILERLIAEKKVL